MSAAAGLRVAGRRTAWGALLLLAAWVMLLAALFRPGGGLTGRYAVALPGRDPAPVHERIDPRIDFPVPQGIDAAYIFHWDMRRLGFPAAMPPYSVRWRGLLEVPRRGVYGFSLEARGGAALRIDGVPLDMHPDVLTERPLQAGLHPIEVDYDLLEGEAAIVLRWRPPGERIAPVPAPALWPDAATAGRSRSRRTAGWALLLSGLLSAAAIARAARRPGGAAARLLDRLAAERVTLALGAILILAALLRCHDYTLVPFHHETADEYQHAWEGWNILHHGMPAAWSTFPDRYPIDRTNDFRWWGDRYVLVWPYFDHPPLFSVVVGLVNSLALMGRPPLPEGLPDYLQCTLPVMRLVPIALSLAGLLLLHRLARAYGLSERAALLAALVYATLPVIVLAHRLVKGESLLALLFMGAILLAQRHEESGRLSHAALAGLLSGLSIWTKATGVAVPAVVLVLLLGSRRRRGALLVAAIAAGSLALYVLYGAALDLDLFLKVIQAQSTTKWVGLEAVQDLLSGKVVTKWFGGGAYLWLLLAAGLAAFRPARRLLLPLAVYGTIIALTADQRVIYGWYRIPLYPFLCVAAGLYLEEMLDGPDLFRVFPFAASAVATGLIYALPAPVAGSKPVVVSYAALALGPFLLRLAHDRPWTRRAGRAGAFLLLGLFLLTSLLTVRGLLEIYSRHAWGLIR